MTLNEIPAWSDIESQPWFASLTPEEKQQSLQKWQGDMMQFAKDPKEKFAVAATSKAKARSFFGEEMPDDPIADALQRRQKDLEDIGSRYDAFSKGELEEDDEEVLTLNDTLKGNTPYSIIKGRLFVSPQLVWDKAAYEKVVNEAPVDEDERVLAMSAYDGSKERAAEGVVNSLGYTDEAFRDFAAKGFKEGKSNAAILDEWKANNKLPDGILGSLRGVGRQAYFGLRSGLSGLERAMGGLGGFFGSESAQKYAEESGKEAQSYMQRTLGEGPEFIGELTSGAVSIIPTIAAGAAASFFTEGAALPAAASITAGAIQSAGATQAETYEFYRNQGLDHANALAESRVDGLVSGLITGAITHYAGKLGDKIGLGKGIEGLFSGPASKIASKLTQREISESLKAGAKAVGGSFLQEGSEELLDQAAQDAYSMIKRDPTLTLAEAINNALQAGKVGAVLGGAAEAGKLGLKSLLNSAKFSVAETPLEKELQSFFEIKQTAADAVVGNPNVQNYVNALGTAKSVVDENLAANNRLTADVLNEEVNEGAEDLKDNIKTDAVKVAADIAPIVNEAPPVVDEAPPPALSKVDTINKTKAELDERAKALGYDNARQLNLALQTQSTLSDEQRQVLEGYGLLGQEIKALSWEDASDLPDGDFSAWAKPRFPAETPKMDEELRDAADLHRALTKRGDTQKAQQIRGKIKDAKRGRWTFESWNERFPDEPRTQEEIDAINAENTAWNADVDAILASFGESPAEAPAISPKPPVSPASETAPIGETPVASFQTSKGSTYDLLPDGTTIRNKAARPEHPGEKGIQPRSSKTIFVTEEGANALGIVQAEGVPFEIRQRKDGTWGAVALEGPSKGKFYKTSLTSASEAPAVGLIPVELWNRPGKKQAVHFGNKITSVSSQPPQGKPVEPPTNALPISPATPSLPREERPEMGLQQVGEGNAQPEKVAETRSEEEVVSVKKRLEEEEKPIPQTIQALHYSREPLEVSDRVQPDQDQEFGFGFYAMEPSDEEMWKTMGRWEPGPLKNEVELTPKNPLVVTPQRLKRLIELAKKDGFSPDEINLWLSEQMESGSYDALIVRGFPNESDKIVVSKKIDALLRENWEPIFPKGKTSGKFVNVDEYNAAANAAVETVTGVDRDTYRAFERLQNQIFIPPSAAPSTIRVTKKPSPPTTGAVPTKTLPAGQEVTPRGVASPGVARDTSKPEEAKQLESPSDLKAKGIVSIIGGSKDAKSFDKWLADQGVSNAQINPEKGDGGVGYLYLDRGTEKAGQFSWSPKSRTGVDSRLVFKLPDGRNVVWLIETQSIYEVDSTKIDPNPYFKEETAFEKTPERMSPEEVWADEQAVMGKYASKEDTRMVHEMDVNTALGKNKPVSAAAVDAYGIKLPEGYVKQGELYVYEKTQPLPKGDAAGERGAVAPAPTVEPAPEARPVSQPVRAFRDAVSQMSPTAQAKWTPELRATAEAYLDSGGTTGLQGLNPIQEKIIKRILDEATRTPEQEEAIRKADAEKLRQEKAKAKKDAEMELQSAYRKPSPFPSEEDVETEIQNAYRASALPPTPGKQIRKIGKGAMESVPVVLDEIAKVIPNIRDLVEVRESVEGEPDAEGFYDPQADKAVVLVDNVYLKPQHGGSQEAALRETIIHELLHRGFAKLRQTNPQLFEQFEAYSLADTNDAQFEALVRRGYSMYSNWKDDPAQNQKAREEIFIRKAVVDLNFKGIEAIKSPTSLASQFFSWLRGLLNKLLGRKVDDETLLHWSRVFLNAAQADFIEKTPGERMHAFAGEKAIENLPEERRQFMRDSLETAKDAEYMAAVKAGDMEKAQRMVDEAAKAAGYDQRWFHKTSSQTPFDVFDVTRGDLGAHFGTEQQATNLRGGASGSVGRYFLRMNSPIRLKDKGGFHADSVAPQLWANKGFRMQGVLSESQTQRWKKMGDGSVAERKQANAEIRQFLISEGYDGVVYANQHEGKGDSVIALTPSQIKSADPVTRDDAGNVIPLSQRFQTVSPDIRYSLGEPPDMQAEADALREVTPSSQALDKFRETFGTPRQDVGQVLGKKEGSVYTQAQVAPLSQHARNVIGFDVNEEGDPIVNPKATQKALDLVSKLLNTKGYASRFNTQAAKLFEGTPVDPEIASAVLVQELQAYANRLSASSPKAEDQILKAALTPFYNTVILGNYLTLRTAGRALQAAGRVSSTDDARKSREEAEKAVNKEITKQLGDEALPAAEGMDKAGVEGGVDAIKDDIPAPADPTLRLLDLAVESLDEVAKTLSEKTFRKLLRLGRLQDKAEGMKKAGNKALSVFTDKSWLEEPLPDTLEEIEAEAAKLREELSKDLADLDAALQGAKPETRKKVKAKAAKTKSKTDSIQKLIDKLSKMPDESKEAKPKAETLRAAIADAIKEKEFDEQKVRDAAAKFGATPEQTERLVEEAERIHEIRQSPKLSKAKLRQFLLSFPKNVLANPEQREALLRSFLKGQNYSEAEINRIAPQVLRDFDTGYQKARKAYLDDLEKKLKPKQGQKESKQDQQNRKMLNALRSGLADTTSETSVALAKSLGFEAFRPQDDHILSKLDEEMRKLREQGRLSDSNAKFDAIKSLLIRRRPPRGFGEVVAQSWITSALSSLSNLAVNVWAPMGEAGVRLMSDIVRATALGKFDEIPLYLEAAGKAMKGTLSRFNFAVKTDTFTNSVNTLIAGMASMKDEMQRSAAVLKDKNASPAAKANAGLRYAMSFGDYSRRILSSIDDTWYTALSSYVGSSNLIKLLGDAKMPKKAVEAIVFHANNDALNQARAEYETLQAVEQFIEAMRGKTNEEIDAGFEYLGLNDASVTKEQANYIQELVSAFQSLRLRSGATGDELIKRALKELRNFRASVSVRATELGQMRTKELVREALSDTQTPAQVEEAIKEFDENAKKAASFGMGLHRVEGVPPYDILGNMFGIVDAMGRQAVQKSPLLGRMIVGFFGIPLNLLNRAVWFTPYGLGRYFLAKWQMAKNPEEKFYEYSMASQRERTMRFTEAAVGTSMTMLLYALGVARDSDDKEDEGFYITLGGPSNKTEYDAWYARGFRKFSICYKTKSGSVVSVPYGRGTGEVLKGPLMLLGAFDDMRLNKKLGDREDMSSVIEYLNAAAAGIGKQATFLGAKNTAGAFFSEQFGTSTASNLAYSAANLIPFNGLDRSISALALGPPDRSRTGAIWANIPIVRHLAHQPAINVFGDPWGNKSESALNQLWDRQWNLGLLPLNISAPLMGNQKRLYNFIGERLMGPSDPLRGALELRNGYLTDEEFYRYKQYRGKQMAQTWLTDLDRWRKLDDDSLSKAIAELSTKATKKAKDRFNYK